MDSPTLLTIIWPLTGLSTGLLNGLEVSVCCLVVARVSSISFDWEMMVPCNSVDSALRTPLSGSRRGLREELSVEDLVAPLPWPAVEPSLLSSNLTFLLLLVTGVF